MSDVLERLRCETCRGPEDGCVICAAIKEIERLREQVEALRRALTAARDADDRIAEGPTFGLAKALAECRACGAIE